MRAAVVTPLYRWPLPPDEQTALRHREKFLARHDWIVISPPGLRPCPEAAHHEHFHPRFFASRAGYNELMLRPEFYRRFRDYEFLLIYQTDCLAFSDALDDWCARGVDYVGAPWFRDCGDDDGTGLHHVGNGGFSLRRVEKFLEALTSRRLDEDPVKRARHLYHKRGGGLLALAEAAAKLACYSVGIGNNIRQVIKTLYEHEDGFWSLHAQRFVDEFRIPSPQEALAFSFERSPRRCYELNGNRLPFGCHGWSRFDRAFWDSFLV